MFGESDGPPNPPTCIFSVFGTPGPHTEPHFCYRIPIEGVIGNEKEIYIIRSLYVESAAGKEFVTFLVVINYYACICTCVRH